MLGTGRAAILLASVSLGAAWLASAEKAPDPALVAKGRAAYKANRCRLCHSVAGEGNPKGPHDGVGSKYTPAELRQWLVDPEAMRKKTGATRTPAMIPFKDLPAEDLDALVAYLSTLKK